MNVAPIRPWFVRANKPVLRRLLFSALIASALLAGAGRAAAQVRKFTPQFSQDIEVVQGEPAEASGELALIFTKGVQQFVVLTRKDLDFIERDVKVDAPPGLDVKLLQVQARAAAVNFRQFEAEYTGDGCVVSCRVQITANGEAPQGKQTVQVSLIGANRIATTNFAELGGYRSEADFRFNVQVFASREARESMRQREAAEVRLQAWTFWTKVGGVLLANLLVCLLAFRLYRKANRGKGVVRIDQSDPVPRVCMCCGASEDVRRSEKTFTWSSWGGSGIAGAVAHLATSRSVPLRVALCGKHRSYWSGRSLLKVLCVLLFFVLLIGGLAAFVWLLMRGESFLATVAMGEGWLLGTIALVFIVRTSIEPVGIFGSSVTLKNVSFAYIRELADLKSQMLDAESTAWEQSLLQNDSQSANPPDNASPESEPAQGSRRGKQAAADDESNPFAYLDAPPPPVAPVEEMVRFACPSCGKELKTPAKMTGRKVGCPKCGSRPVVPDK